MGTVTKALNLLDQFSSDRPEIGLSDMGRLTGHDKATVFRYLAELEAGGFVEQDSRTRCYRLGPAVLRLAAVRRDTVPSQQAIADLVSRMAERLDELVHVSQLVREGLTTLCHSDSRSHATRVTFDPGEVLPLHATASGIAVLAFGPAGLFETVMNGPLAGFTTNTAMTRDSLLSAVQVARQTGFSLGNATFDEGVQSIALPLFAGGSDAFGAVAVAFPEMRESIELRRDIKTLLPHAAVEISTTLGGAVPRELLDRWHAPD